MQSEDNEITEDMINNILYIINSAQYTNVKKSIFENGVFTETLSTILTVGIPIAILVVIYLLITKVGKKGRSKLSSEEAELRCVPKFFIQNHLQMLINPHNTPLCPCEALCEKSQSLLQLVHRLDIPIFSGFIPSLTILK